MSNRLSQMHNVSTRVQSGDAVTSTVIALHCSGATGSQWRGLERHLGSCFTLIAPDLIGAGETAHWAGAHAFKLSDETARVVRLIDAAKGRVHLVGHCYGGCVALRASVERAAKVASVALYEPAVLHVLGMMSSEGSSSLEEISVFTGHISRLVSNGDYQAAARLFAETQNGKGSWLHMRRQARDELARYMPKLSLELAAQFGERTPLYAYRRLNFPILLLHGEFAPEPFRLIAWQLARAMKLACLQTVDGAGHMGPFSHAAAVSAMIADWIERAEPDLPPRESDPAPDIHRAA